MTRLLILDEPRIGAADRCGNLAVPRATQGRRAGDLLIDKNVEALIRIAERVSSSVDTWSGPPPFRRWADAGEVQSAILAF